MVEMSRSFTLPPVIQRFGRCGGSNDDIISEEVGLGTGNKSGYRNNHQSPSSPSFLPLQGGSATAGSERVKSFVSGIVSPFTACWQPSVSSCVSGCGAPDVYSKQPAVVSPIVDRQNSYRSRRPTQYVDQEDYSYPHSYCNAGSSSRSHSHYPRSNGAYLNHQNSYHQNLSPPRKDNIELKKSQPPDTGTVAVAASTYENGNQRLTNIEQPRSNDILCGRGGSSNRHLGNIHFRELVAANKKVYVNLTKKQKMLVARKIVDAIHSTNGRFLAKDLDTGLFYDIGLPRSLEKTSQALREKNSNEMPTHLIENESIETSVESYQSVIQKDSKQVAGESSHGKSSPPNKSTASHKSKTVETPPLIIPQHLMSVFGQKTLAIVREREEDFDYRNNHIAVPVSSPRMNYDAEQQPQDHHVSSYPQSPYSSPPHYRHTYPQVNPSPGNPRHLHPPTYPTSPANGGEGRYHYQSHHQQPQLYGQQCNGYNNGRYSYHNQDHYKQYDCREMYDGVRYYRCSDYDQTVSTMSPHQRRPHAHFHHQYNTQQYPSLHHGSIHQSGLHPKHGSSAACSKPQPCSPSQHTHQLYHEYYPDAAPTPSMPHPRSHLTDPSSPSSPRIIFRTTSNGYVRGNSDISPERQREMKRQRNVDGHRTSDMSLSSAVSNSLSLEERVVGSERERQEQEQKRATNSDDDSSSQVDLISPSMILQARSGRRDRLVIDEKGRTLTSEKKDDYSSLSGLAALSTAAFLKLDESKD